MRKRCSAHGDTEVPVAADAGWYARTVAGAPRSRRPSSDAARPFPGLPVRLRAVRGSRADARAAHRAHHQRMQPRLPDLLHAQQERRRLAHEPRRVRDALAARAARRARASRIINLTGGEPTMHPTFERLVALSSAKGIHRVRSRRTVCACSPTRRWSSTLARCSASASCSRSTRSTATATAPSSAATSWRASDACSRCSSKHGVGTTLSVIARGHNDHDLGRLVVSALDTSCVRSLELHTLTFTGQGGTTSTARARMTPDEVLRALECRPGAAGNDFVPSPAAHPLCYQMTYLSAPRRRAWVPFTRFMRARRSSRDARQGLYLEPTPSWRRVHRSHRRLWTGEASAPTPKRCSRRCATLRRACSRPAILETER